MFKHVWVNSKSNVLVYGANGHRAEGLAKNQASIDGPGGYPDGTKVVIYSFFTKGRTYTLQYVQKAGYPDVLTDFDLMVTKTFKLSS